MSLVDTHCHIQSIGGIRNDLTTKKWRESGITDPDKVIGDASAAGVASLICVGTDLADSQAAAEFVRSRPNCWAALGIHPHEAAEFLTGPHGRSNFEALVMSRPGKLVAIGEIGLDYYYEHSPKAQQKELLEFQLTLATHAKLPVIFHVRDAFEDFWSIIDKFPGITGVIHSFSADSKELERIVAHNFYIGLNGIMTFTKDPEQLTAAKRVPLDRLLLETDAPYLTPKPYRGKICKPEHVRQTAGFLAELRGEPPEQLASTTTRNARQLFGM